MEKQYKDERAITMIGTSTKFRGIGSYLNMFIENLANYIAVDVIDFKDLYPKFLYKSKVRIITELDNNLKEKVRRSNIQITYWNPLSWLNAFFFIKTKSMIIHWWNPFLFPIYFIIMVCAHLTGKKVITVVHNTKFHESHFVYEMLHLIIIWLSDFILVHGESNKQNFGVDFDQNKIGVIWHGIPQATIQTPENKKEWREKLKIPENHFTLLFIGTIRYYKGLDIFLDALELLYKNGSTDNLSVVIAGHPWIDVAPVIERLNAMKDKINIIYRFEFIPDNELYGYYYASDLTVLPYKEFNAQSSVAGESLSLGVPAIASDLPSLKDWFGNIDAYFKTNNSESLAAKILSLKSSPDAYRTLRMGEDQLRQSLSWDAAAKQLINILDKWGAL